MPNWVNNTLTISAENPETIYKIKQQLSQPLPAFTDDDGKFREPEATPLSFWNIIHPPLDKLDEYHGTHGWKDGKQVGDTEYNWYPWNNRNWGTKWDACHPEMFEDGTNTIGYTFDTAWSPPTCFNILSEQYPDAQITLRYVEEQGWGGEEYYEGGHGTEVASWEIPDSHEAWVELEGECRSCMWHEEGEDTEDLYDDCPPKIEARGEFLEDVSEMIG